MDKDDIQLWLALKLVPRLAAHRKIALVKEHGLTKLFSYKAAQLQAFGLSKNQANAIAAPDWQAIADIIAKSDQAKSQIVTYSDPAYPSLLAQIYDPPLVLWAKGDKTILNTPQIAIVGSRAATQAGREYASQLASELSSVLTITSGLALGVDAAAHQGALHARQNTVAVIATGIDKVYPARHKLLARNMIEQGGVIVTEFMPGTVAKPGHFPRRNRIISGLSLGTVVVEAEVKSGSLVTAKSALEQNREVFAVPGSPLNPMAKGCHQLIKQGAKLIDCAADIIEELVIPGSSGHVIQVDEKIVKTHQQGLLNDALLASVDYEITPVDMVVSRSKLPTDEVLTRLTMLELSGLVSAVPGGYLRLHRG
ncbi:DNA-protecting protein DprA [Thalassotalea euphylliae]|uniref:DNA-protecting protein DprA n=1 Tax=Thalassotalea euphylliae TaxID=1655234 RepID=A0A3E0TL91_9GAMM|nr:DNA-processing protein DprA [Thalassotalea euphylliae]REL25107.1 DNA-protecting protein DprA [Thalassotalea euphylliae]